MRAMPMPSLTLSLRASSPGVYRGTGRKLTMPGRWEIRVRIVPRGASPVEIVLVVRVASDSFEVVDQATKSAL